MKYKHFLGKLTCTDAVLDTVDKENVEVTCNKVENVPVLFFKNGDEVIDIKLGSTYKEEGVSAKFLFVDVSNKISIFDNINTEIPGKYQQTERRLHHCQSEAHRLQTLYRPAGHPRRHCRCRQVLSRPPRQPGKDKGN